MNQSPLIRITLHYGVLSGLTYFVFYLLLYLTGMNVFGMAGFLGIWIPVVFIILATRNYRESQPGIQLRYGQAFAAGVFTTLFSSSLFGLCYYLLGTLYATDLLDLYRAQAELSLEEGKSILSENMMELAMEGIENTTMSSLSFSESFNKLLWGGMVSLITAAFLRGNAGKEEHDWK